MARILIVEADEKVAGLFKTVLLDEGHEIVHLYNGMGAEHLIENSRIDLVITCFQMQGGMNGVDLAEKVKAKNPTLPVVVVATTVPDSPSVDAFLSKPVSPVLLAARVRQLLKIKK